jgi:RNA polymerase sigma-70 factor (ECF subfamily)
MPSERALDAWFDEGRAAWPAVSLARERFAAHVARLGLAEDETLHVGDLYLACACADGDATAVRALDAQLISAVPGFVARVDSSATFGADVAQAVRSHLLVGASGTGAIASYAGRGALKSWIHVTALRIALRLRKSRAPAIDLADVESILATPDPQLAFIKHRAREDFRLAFQTALAQLSPPERHLLRIHYLDGLSLAQIGAVEKLDKSTISRRLGAIREALLTETRRLMRERLRLDEGELESLMGVIASQLDVSIESFLKTR